MRNFNEITNKPVTCPVPCFQFAQVLLDYRPTLVYVYTRMWANAQCDGWRTVFNAAKFG